MKNGIHILFPGVVFYLIFVAGENIYLPFNPGQIIVFSSFLLTFLLIACWVQSSKNDKNLLKLSGITLFIFFLWGIVGQSFSIDPELSYYGFLKYLSAAIFIIAASLYSKNEKNVSVILWTCLVSSIINAFIVIGQHYSLSWVHLEKSLWGNSTVYISTHGVEARKWGNPSTFSNINYFSCYLLLQLPIAVALFFNTQTPWKKSLSAVAFGLIVISLIYSKSIGGQIVAALEIILLLLVYLGWASITRKIAVAGGIVIGIISILLIVATALPADYKSKLFIRPPKIDLGHEPPLQTKGERVAASKNFELLGIPINQLVPVKLERAIVDGNILSRTIYWRVAWEIAKEKPLTGTGSLTFGALYPYFKTKIVENLKLRYIQKSPPHAHNLYFQILSDHGWIGLIIFAGFLFVWFKRVFDVIQISDKTPFKKEALAVAIACFGFLTQNFMEVNWLVSSFIFHFALLVVIFDFYHSQIFPKKNNAPHKIYLGISIILCLVATFSAYCFRQYNQILKVEILHSQRAETFIQIAEKAERFCPSCASAKVIFAKTLLQEYKINPNPTFLEEAQNKLEDAVLKNPYHVLVLTYLGNIYGLQGRKEEALQKLSLALKLYPNSPEAKEGFAKLNINDSVSNSSQKQQ
jgi:tetratricopeptide (TPR) repeat protein